jgi:folate-binding protein YgfZ
LHERLLEIGLPGGLRAIGWHAYNMARIEAGTPIFLTDFGPGTLPHETGRRVLDQAVSFSKGCYPGQEVVARMQNLGHPKQVLTGIRIERDAVPMTGAFVLDRDADDAETIGAITSAAPCPMLGNIAGGFAMMQWSKANVGDVVFIDIEGTRAPAHLSDTPLWKP